MAAVDAEAEAVHVLDVLDAGQGLTRLLRREPTLDGAVPLRVAQACMPLLDGIAWGFQVSLQRPVVLVQKLGGWKPENDSSELNALQSAAAARLRAHGFVDGSVKIPPMLEIRKDTVHLWTGLLIRPTQGLWAHLSAVSYRRNWDFSVEDHLFTDHQTLTPLVLRLRLSSETRRVVLSGEVACLAPLMPGAQVSTTTLQERPEIGRAHAAFYDPGYFEAKKTGVTRRYRKLVAHVEDTSAPACQAEFVTAGPTRSRVASMHGDDGSRLDVVEVRNEIAFSAAFDGHTLRIDSDPSHLQKAAAQLETQWADVYGPAFLEENRGALLYLQKYFTQHPPGEPHFFIKPFAFVKTPPGWSCLLEGIHGRGFDVLRGVIHTDVFHATPAVFQLHSMGATHSVDAGALLLRVIPIPRALLRPRVEWLRWPDEAP